MKRIVDADRQQDTIHGQRRAKRRWELLLLCSFFPSFSMQFLYGRWSIAVHISFLSFAIPLLPYALNTVVIIRSRIAIMWRMGILTQEIQDAHNADAWLVFFLAVNAHSFPARSTSSCMRVTPRTQSHSMLPVWTRIPRRTISLATASSTWPRSWSTESMMVLIAKCGAIVEWEVTIMAVLHNAYQTLSYPSLNRLVRALLQRKRGRRTFASIDLLFSCKSHGGVLRERELCFFPDRNMYLFILFLPLTPIAWTDETGSKPPNEQIKPSKGFWDDQRWISASTYSPSQGA